MPPKVGSTVKCSGAACDSKPCVLCPHGDDEQNFGEILRDDRTPAHFFCLLFASGLAQRGEESEGSLGFLPKDIKQEMRRGAKLVCTFCKRKSATIGCYNPRCNIKCHFGCGRSNDMMFIFKDDFKVFCVDHRPTQTRLSQANRSRLSLEKSSMCSICYSPVSTYISCKVLRSPCCEKNFYHRHCVDKLAYSAGIHFLRCPMCNDKDKFQAEMLDFGIHIPDRDATWELEPQAYESLLERHSRCDQENCLCPEGRSADRMDSEWELILCASCGSQGTHVKCESLTNTRFTRWLCVDCKPVFERSIVEKRQTRSRTRSPKFERMTNAVVEIYDESDEEIVIID